MDMLDSTVMPVMAFMMQVGARHITFDMTDAQRKLMQHPFMKGSVLFAMFLVTTRKVSVAIILTLMYFLMTMVLLNEKHEFNIFSKSWLKQYGFMQLEEMQDSLGEKYKNNLEAILFAKA